MTCPARASLLILVWANFASGTQAYGQGKDLQPVQHVMALTGEGKPLAAITVAESSSLDGNFASQLLPLLYSFVGDCQKYDNLQSRLSKDLTVALPEHATVSPAIDAIVENARERRIVIVNEAHGSPEHRVFIMQLARRLRDVGFSYYAMETLQEEPQLLKERGYPVLSTGFYTMEPVYGQLEQDVPT